MTAPERNYLFKPWLSASWLFIKHEDGPIDLTQWGEHAQLVEYIRIDLHDDTKAQLAECEARLEKAVEALRFYAPREFDGITFTGNDDAGVRARAVLAEIEKGGV